MKVLSYYYCILLVSSLLLQVSWASGEPGGKIKVEPQSLPICSIGEEDPKDENSNKYAIFEPEKIKEYDAKGQFAVTVVESPEPDKGYALSREEYAWTVTEKLKIENADQDTCTVKSSAKGQWGKVIIVTCKMSFYESKDGQEKYLTDLTATYKILTPLVVVSQISFNHVPGKHENDAMDLKKTYDGKVISCPEATFDDDGKTTKSDPFLYLGGKKSALKIKAKVKPGIIEKAKIKTKPEIPREENILPELGEKEFDNKKNEEFEIYFKDNIESKLNAGTQKWTWRLTEIQGTALVGKTVGFETTVKKGYILFTEPLSSPWNMNNDKKKPWVKALDVAIKFAGNAGLDQNSSDVIIRNITNYTFKTGFKYDTKNGKARYVLNDNGIIDLNSYLVNRKQGGKVNCLDQSFSLTALSRLVGINAESVCQEPFGKILVVNLVGIEQCNNPFCGDPYTGIKLDPENVTSEEYDSLKNKKVDKKIQLSSGTIIDNRAYPERKGFGYHAYVRFSGSIYDSCVGPAMGETPDSYQKKTIEDPPTDFKLTPRTIEFE